VRNTSVETANFISSVEKFKLHASLTILGQDLQVIIWGGDKPHIGAVALAQSRPSLENPEKTSSTSSILSIVGHKENIVVQYVSEKLSATLKTNVAVTAGMHWNVFDEEDIEMVMRSVDNLLQLIINFLQSKGLP